MHLFSSLHWILYHYDYYKIESKMLLYSGLPYILDNESWPKCKQCDTPLGLLVQLNIDEMPLI